MENGSCIEVIMYYSSLFFKVSGKWYSDQKLVVTYIVNKPEEKTHIYSKGKLTFVYRKKIVTIKQCKKPTT